MLHILQYRRYRFLAVCLAILPILAGLPLIQPLLTAPAAEPAPAISVIVDGQALQMEVNPIIVNGRVLVPVRAIAEALGAPVDWDPGQQMITMQSGSSTVRLWIGQSRALKSEQEIALDTAPCIVDDRTLAPLRFVSEALGANVEWRPDTREVVIATASSLPSDSTNEHSGDDSALSSESGYDQPGIYGPATGIQDVNGNVFINSDGVTLQNLAINGSLTIGKPAASRNEDGDTRASGNQPLAGATSRSTVVLNNVTVAGKFIINGGVADNIILVGFNCGLLEVDDPQGTVHISARGQSNLKQTTLASGASLEELNLTGDGKGFADINITAPRSSSILISGDIEQVICGSSGTTLQYLSGTLQKLLIDKTASGCAVNLSSASRVNACRVDGPALLSGSGFIASLEVYASGTVQYFSLNVNTIEASQGLYCHLASDYRNWDGNRSVILDSGGLNLDQVSGASLSPVCLAAWNPVNHATAYRVQIYRNGAVLGAPLIVAGLNTNCLAAIRAGGTGDYYVTVTATGGYADGYSDGLPSSPSEIRTATRVPTVAQGIWNIDNATWAPVAGAASYDIQLYKDGTALGTPHNVAAGGPYSSGFAAEMTAAGNGIYTFQVTALGNGLLILDAAPSPESSYNTSRLPVLNISAGGLDMVNWNGSLTVTANRPDVNWSIGNSEDGGASLSAASGIAVNILGPAAPLGSGAGSSGRCTITATDGTTTRTMTIYIQGNGTRAYPYVILNGACLNAVRGGIANDGAGHDTSGYDPGKFYKMVADISLAAYADWTPINVTGACAPDGAPDGNESEYLRFNGYDHLINNLQLNSNGDNKGLFGIIAPASGKYFLSHVIIDGPVVNCISANNAGALAGYLSRNVLISQVRIEGGTVSGYTNTGGLTGFAYSGTGTVRIAQCSSSAAVEGTSYNTGGLAGNFWGYPETIYLDRCYATGNVSGQDNSGGLVGYSYLNVKINNCYATGNTSGFRYTGGLIGYANDSAVAINNCYASGAVTGGGLYHSGLVGMAYGVDVSSSPLITNCLAFNPSVTGFGSDCHRVCYGGQRENNYGQNGMTINTVPIVGGSYTNEEGRGVDAATAVISPSTTHFYDLAGPNGMGWDIVNIWNVVDGSLPTLRNVP